MTSSGKPFPKFYPVVPDAAWVARLVPLGVRVIQLRLKNADSAEIRAQIMRAREVCTKHNCQLIVNDYWREAIELGVDFIHLGQEDLAAADLPAIRAAGVRFGLSTHDKSELQTALDAEPAYVALGPVYETSLKKMKWNPQGLEKLRKWADISAPVPLVAIGGITLERAPGVLAAGADSIAVVTDVVYNEQPEARVKAWLKTLG